MLGSLKIIKSMRVMNHKKVDIQEKHAKIPTFDVSSQVILPFVVSQSHNI